jgi:hypothetical protein
MIMLVVVIGAFLLVALCGGFIHMGFTRYSPSGSTPNDESFKLSIHPEFSTGGTRGLKTAIPLLLRYQRENSADPRMILNLTPHSPIYGYENKVSLTLTHLTAKDETGNITVLISPESERSFNVRHNGYGSRREDLGAITGSQIEISASGYTVSDTGEREPFEYNRIWRSYSSSRSGLAIAMSE